MTLIFNIKSYQPVETIRAINNVTVNRRHAIISPCNIIRCSIQTNNDTNRYINPLTAGAAYIWVFIFISTLSTTF